MYCLLCHEKIPRLRAWRTKSEFCSDEHAAQYKKQTLDRLLTDQNPARKEKPNPIAAAEDLDDAIGRDEMSDVAHDINDIPVMADGAESGELHDTATLDAETSDAAAFDTEIFDTESLSTEALDLPSDAEPYDDSTDGIEELWRLAEEVEESGPETFQSNGSSESEVPRQSAEEALKALRMLAERATESKTPADLDKVDSMESLRNDSEPEFDEIDDLPPISDALMAQLEDDLPSFDDEAPEPKSIDELAEAPLEAEATEDQATGDDVEEPAPVAESDEALSILERLMEDPVTDWPERPAAAAPAAETLDDAPDPLAEFEDLPEPEFEFEEEAVDAVAEETVKAVAEEALDVVAEETVEAVARDDAAAASDAAPEPSDEEADASVSIEDDPLAGLEAFADEDSDPEIDPLAELIRAEEAARVSEDAADDSSDRALDEAVADHLVSELAEEAFRDDLDLQELERSLKVVPFPSPDTDPVKNGHRKHADEIVADADEVLEANPIPPVEEPAKATAAEAKPEAKPSKASRQGRSRTKFKPSMVMAGVEPSLQGHQQGDPLESWRSSAVRSAWGDEGSPAAHVFRAPPLERIAEAESELQALRPERSYRGRLSVPMAVCKPAEAPEVEAPVPSIEPAHAAVTPQSPAALSAADETVIRLGPEYRAFEGVAAVGLEGFDGEGLEIPASLRESTRKLCGALAPAGLFYDSVSVEERFADEEEWEVSQEAGAPATGIDLSEDFASEQPAAQSSGGGRGREYR